MRSPLVNFASYGSPARSCTHKRDSPLRMVVIQAPKRGELGMARFDLTDQEWAIIAPLLPTKPRGVPRQDDRRVLNGFFWPLRTGSPWRDLPKRYGPTR